MSRSRPCRRFSSLTPAGPRLRSCCPIALQRTDSAIGAVQRHAARIADLRSRQHDSAHSTGDGGGRLHSLPFGGKQRQVQSTSTRRRCAPRLVRQRRRGRNRRSESDFAGRHSEDRLARVLIKLNASPTQIEDLNNIPIGARNGTVTYVRDVAQCGTDTRRKRTSSASKAVERLDERPQDRQARPRHHQQHQREVAADPGSLPPELKIEPLSDQSVFVRAAISGVIGRR